MNCGLFDVHVFYGRVFYREGECRRDGQYGATNDGHARRETCEEDGWTSEIGCNVDDDVGRKKCALRSFTRVIQTCHSPEKVRNPSCLGRRV